MNTQPRSFPRGDIRVSDAERDQAIADLSAHFQAGRLTQEEFEDRSGRALQARTRSDLSELFTDLPPQGMVPAPQAGGPATDPPAGPGSMRRAGRVPVASVIIACVVAAIIASNVLGGTGHRPGGIGWLIPVVILGSVFLRLARRRL